MNDSMREFNCHQHELENALQNDSVSTSALLNRLGVNFEIFFCSKIYFDWSINNGKVNMKHVLVLTSIDWKRGAIHSYPTRANELDMINIKGVVQMTFKNNKYFSCTFIPFYIIYCKFGQFVCFIYFY